VCAACSEAQAAGDGGGSEVPFTTVLDPNDISVSGTAAALPCTSMSASAAVVEEGEVVAL
jgi:hypothetical protein